jgi:secreted trypsin-like serine protease
MLSRPTSLIAFAAVVAAAGLVPTTPAGAVANGSPAPEGRYRFAVRLSMTDIPRPDGTRYNSACSAALVSAWWIITAGHCFHDPQRNPVSGPVPYETAATVDRAVNDGAVKDATVKVVSVQQAPAGDIALARLAAPVNDVLPLRVSDKAPRAGDVLRIAGWGKLAATDPAPAAHLQTGRFKVSSVAAGTVGLKGYRPAADTSACDDDSGAPYFAETGRFPVLVSVESDGPSCPHAREETTTRVDVLARWIRGKLRT